MEALDGFSTMKAEQIFNSTLGKYFNLIIFNSHHTVSTPGILNKVFSLKLRLRPDFHEQNNFSFSQKSQRDSIGTKISRSTDGFELIQLFRWDRARGLFFFPTRTWGREKKIERFSGTRRKSFSRRSLVWQAWRARSKFLLLLSRLSIRKSCLSVRPNAKMRGKFLSDD